MRVEESNTRQRSSASGEERGVASGGVAVARMASVGVGASSSGVAGLATMDNAFPAAIRFCGKPDRSANEAAVVSRSGSFKN